MSVRVINIEDKVSHYAPYVDIPVVEKFEIFKL